MQESAVVVSMSQRTLRRRHDSHATLCFRICGRDSIVRFIRQQDMTARGYATWILPISMASDFGDNEDQLAAWSGR